MSAKTISCVYRSAMWPSLLSANLTITARLLLAPAPQERDGERSDRQQDDADAVEVCGPRQTNDGCEKACRKRGKAEGKIALDKIGGQQASAFAWLSIRQHAPERSGKDCAEAYATDERSEQHDAHVLILDTRQRYQHAECQCDDAENKHLLGNELAQRHHSHGAREGQRRHDKAPDDWKRRTRRRADDRGHERKVEPAQGPGGDVDRRDGQERGAGSAWDVHAWPQRCKRA